MWRHLPNVTKLTRSRARVWWKLDLDVLNSTSPRVFYYNFIISFYCTSAKNKNKTSSALNFQKYVCVCAVVSSDPWLLDKILPTWRNVALCLALCCVTRWWNTHSHRKGEGVRMEDLCPQAKESIYWHNDFIISIWNYVQLNSNKNIYFLTIPILFPALFKSSPLNYSLIISSLKWSSAEILHSWDWIPCLNDPEVASDVLALWILKCPYLGDCLLGLGPLGFWWLISWEPQPTPYSGTVFSWVLERLRIIKRLLLPPSHDHSFCVCKE